MSEFQGMVVEDVQNLGHLLQSQIGHEIDSIISQINSRLQSTQWNGADRRQFESDWHGSYTVQLRHIQQSLATFGQHALQEAQQQVEASTN